MKTYKEFNEAAALVLPALKAAPYVIPALGVGANILKGMMQSSMLKSDASDRFKARQRGGRLTPGEAQRRQAREDRRAEAQRRARENTSATAGTVSKPNTENIPTAKKPDREKVDPRLERAANQVIDSLRRGNTLSKKVTEENKHKDAKLNYQYKQLQDPKPKKVIDVLKNKKGMA